jgi:hypothetical protein
MYILEWDWHVAEDRNELKWILTISVKNKVYILSKLDITSKDVKETHLKKLDYLKPSKKDSKYFHITEANRVKERRTGVF